MSAKVSGLVWELDLPHSQLLVLLALADHAHHDGTRVYPSLGLVAWKVGYSVRQVRRIVRQLIDRRLLVEEHPGGGRGKGTHYRIDAQAGPQKAPWREPGNPDTVTGFPKNPDTVTGFPQNPDIAVTGFPPQNPDTVTGFSAADAPNPDIAVSLNPDIAVSGETSEPSLLLPTVPIADANRGDGAEAMHAVLSGFADRGYTADPAFLRVLAAKHPGIGLELEAHKIAEWLTEPRNAKRRCSKRFLDNWLTTAARPAPAQAAGAVPGPGGLVHPNSQRKNPGPAPVLPEGVDLQPVRPADVERALTERKRIPYEDRLAQMRNGAAPAPAGGAA